MDVLSTIVTLSGLVFVVSSMLAMGLSLTVPAIIEKMRRGSDHLIIPGEADTFNAFPILFCGNPGFSRIYFF